MQVEEVPFTELLSDIVDNRGKTCPTADSGIPLIATNCIRNDLLYPAYEKIRYVSQETYDTWFRGHPKPGDLIFVTKGTPGRVCMAPDPVDFCIAQDMVAVRADPKKVYPKYLFALLRSPMIQARIEQMHVGTLIPHFKKGDFDKLLLPILDRDAQRLIGGTYFELSAKIELNRHVNETLEGIARAIFKSWFVDFDPVRAKATGQQLPGLASHIADLFPDEFEESELGEIPRGWKVDAILTVCELLSGGTPSTKVPEYWDGDIKWVSARDVSGAHGTFLLDTERTITQQGVDNSSTKILPELTTIVTARGTVGSYCILAEPMAMNQTNYGLKATMEDADYFVFFALGSLVHQLKQRAYGTIFDTVTTRTFKTSQVVIPPGSLISKFDQLVQPTMEAIRQNLKQSCTLAALRDTLLPRLISGELRVPDAEKFCVEVGL